MNATRLLQFSRQFGAYCGRRFAPLSQRYHLSMREIDVLLFLANNPCYDTARDITEYRGISKSQVSQAVDLLTEQGSGWQVTFLHTEETDTLLPAYMASLRRLCRRAMAETPGLTVDFQE